MMSPALVKNYDRDVLEAMNQIYATILKFQRENIQYEPSSRIKLDKYDHLKGPIDHGIPNLAFWYYVLTRGNINR